MRLLTAEAFHHLRSGASVIEQDHYGEKVLTLRDGTYLKLFRRKSWLSKSTIVPPAKRFEQNARSLSTLDIPAPKVIAIFRMRSPYRSIVHYAPLEGETLRQLIKQSDAEDQRNVLSGLGDFIGRLHDKGVYFRSLHFGNIVLTPGGTFGLIDIADMRCLGRPLSNWMRRRNYQHLMRYRSDWELLNEKLRMQVQSDIIRC